MLYTGIYVQILDASTIRELVNGVTQPLSSPSSHLAGGHFVCNVYQYKFVLFNEAEVASLRLRYDSPHCGANVP